MKKKQKKT